MTITGLFENQTCITKKPVKLFHKYINGNVIHMSVFNIFMLKYLCDSRNLCIAEHFRPQKQANHKPDLAGRCLHLFF